MDIILTHEQADFDAMAALLGAHLLNEKTFCVLPYRLNRNVRAFITLYGSELPFIESRDLPPANIEHLTLVDTQSLITLKGQTQKTRIHVVDHHQLRSELPKEWSHHIERLGACTTLFVEEMYERFIQLNSIQATLLLLGIYEDTGALTYSATTARDVRAAAFLLEQGASLRLLSEYLNPPLSREQRLVYDRLLSAAEHYQINDQTVIVCCANAEDTHEEISSIAHKLRDLLNPDALFLLVITSEGIRIVARSTTDRVNVAEIANLFGGGGHDRAAAALIKPGTPHYSKNSEETLKNVHQELVRVLSEKILPSLTVGNIMSLRPQTISAEVSTQEANRLMHRYGYEGFPVVQNKKIVGLLTRRAVDRAISHKLNLPAGSLMEAGEVTVAPQDSVEYLQKIMISSGWGQIPVVEPSNGEIIGIVTRTDLLKSLPGRESRYPGKQNLSVQLESSLPHSRLVLLKRIAAEAHARHMGIYIVGGYVRDLLLKRPGLDFDIVIEGDAIHLARILSAQIGGRVVSHARFGTAKWWIGEDREKVCAQLVNSQPAIMCELPEFLDLISARTEFYERPTALPTVERSSIKLDLHRRDFTINTLALRLDGQHYGDLYDYWDGLNDLKHGLIRVLHSLSFVDDPTRMLRAVRFEQRFGFQIEQRTLQLINEAGPLLRQVSGERLQHELNLILAEEKAPTMLKRLSDLGLLKYIHPALDWNDRIAPALTRALYEPLPEGWDLVDPYGHRPLRQTLGYTTWLAHLPEQEIKEIAASLRFPAHLTNSLLAANQIQTGLEELNRSCSSQIYSLLEKYPLPGIYAVICLEPQERVQPLLDFALILRKVRPYTDGLKLRALNIPPGPKYKYILDKLHNAWLDGEITTPEQESQLLQQLINLQVPDDK